MEKNRLKEYATRVTQANRSQLVVIIFEASIESIHEGKKYMLAGKLEESKKEINRGKALVNELLSSLDMQYEISHYLRHLYIYAIKQLCQGIAKKEPELFDESTSILEALLKSFREVAKSDDSDALMTNTQTIFAGLTYGKGVLNESIGVGVSVDRGYKA